MRYLFIQISWKTIQQKIPTNNIHLKSNTSPKKVILLQISVTLFLYCVSLELYCSRAAN